MISCLCCLNKKSIGFPNLSGEKIDFDFVTTSLGFFPPFRVGEKKKIFFLIMKKEDCYFLGTITRTHGLQGNVVLKLDTDQPEMYNKLESIFVEVNGLLVPFFVEKQSWSKADTKIISFKNSSEALVNQSLGKGVYLPLSTLPPLTGKKFYYHEVVGFEIREEDGKTCGNIVSINDQTAQNYFILDLAGKEIIIPIIKDWILEVNREEKFIQMFLPEGLMDVFLVPSKKDE